MEYFFLKTSTDPKVIGKYPQSEKMCGEEFGKYDYRMPYSVRWIPSEGTLKTKPKVDCFELKHHAKTTDLISTVQVSSFAALLISERFYALIQDFKCMPALSFQSQVVHRDKKHPYQFLYFPEQQNQFIDFSRSRFMLSTPVQGTNEHTRTEITFKDFDEYLQKCQVLERLRLAGSNPNERHYIQVTDLYINDSVADLDFFRLLHLNNNFFVSARLKETIEQHGLSGMQFIPANGAKIFDFDGTSIQQLIY